MDCSEEYVIMCQKAEEIQKLRKSFYEEGDFYYGSGRCAVRIAHDREWKPSSEIWLPRQDQLVEMVKDSEIYIHKHPGKQWCLWEDVDEGGPMGISYYDTPEQLFLAFVMKERFNKVWDSEKKEWIKK